MKMCLRCGDKFDKGDWNCPSCGFTPVKYREFFAFAPELAERNEGFNPNGFIQLNKSEETNFWFTSRNCLIKTMLRTHFPGARNFLEIGCGTGFVLSGIEKSFPELSLFGSEIYTLGLSFAAKRLKNSMLFQMDARQIPFYREFDVVGAFDVLEHINEDDLVLSQIFKALDKGGGLILTVPQHKWLWSRADEYACHVRRYTGRELREKVERVGFKVERMTSFVSLLLPLMILSRFASKYKKTDYDPYSELKLNEHVNFMLKKFLDIERVLINLGINLPLGGSLILIARKV